MSGSGHEYAKLLADLERHIERAEELDAEALDWCRAGLDGRSIADFAPLNLRFVSVAREQHALTLSVSEFLCRPGQLGKTELSLAEQKSRQSFITLCITWAAMAAELVNRWSVA